MTPEALEQTGEVLLSILSQGGKQALWGLTLYFGYSLLRVLVIGGAWCLVIHFLTRGALTVSSEISSRRQQRIHLVSEEVSERLGRLISRLYQETLELQRLVEKQQPSSESGGTSSSSSPGKSESTSEESSD